VILIILYLSSVTVDCQNLRTKRQGVKGRPPAPIYDTQEDISDVGAPQRTRPSVPRPRPQPQPQEDEGDVNSADGEANPEPPIYGGVMGTPGVDFPGYTQIPKTGFTCSGVPFEPGMYADMETQCQAYHMCFQGRKESFLCGVGTVFNQAILGCDYWHSVDCSKTPDFYSINEELGKAGAEPGPGGAPPASAVQPAQPFRPAPAPGPVPRPRQPSPAVSRPQPPRIPSQPVQTQEEDVDYESPQIPQPAPQPRPKQPIPQPPPPQKQPPLPRQPPTRPQPQPPRYQPPPPATKVQPAISQRPQQPFRPAPVVPQRPQPQPPRKIPQQKPSQPRQPVQRPPPAPLPRPVPQPRPAPVPRPVPQPRPAPAPRPIAPRPSGKTSPARPVRPLPPPPEPQRPIVQTRDEEPVDDSQQSFDY
ncbi:unnamed protein product, partial [Oppiella nova]